MLHYLAFGQHMVIYYSGEAKDYAVAAANKPA